MSEFEIRGARLSSDVLRVLGAISAPERVRILFMLEGGGLGYSELMRAVGMVRRRDVGRFSYHLRRLLEAGLVEVDRESKLYRLSGLGVSVVELLKNLSLRVDLGGVVFVRRSFSLVEPFDKLRIVDSLVAEAGVPARVAGRIASRVENALVGLGLSTVDSSVIRCLVGYELLSRGLGGYFLRYFLVGPSMYEVSQAVRRGLGSGDSLLVEETIVSDVLGRYVFRRVLPRELVECCYDGLVELYRPDSWINAFLGFGLLSESRSVGIDELFSALLRFRMVRDEVVVAGQSVSWNVVDRLVELLRGVRFGSAGLYVCSRADLLSGRLGMLEGLVAREDLMCSYSLLDGYVSLSRLADGLVLFNSFGRLGVGGSSRVVVGGLFGVNVGGIFLRSEGRVNLVLSRLGELLRHVLQAVMRRHGFLDRLHRELGGVPCYYFVAPVGLREVLGVVGSGGSSSEASRFLRDVLSVFRDVLSGSSGRRLKIVTASVWPSVVSESLFKRDVASLGSQVVSRVLGGVGGYSNCLFDFSCPGLEETIHEVAGYFDAGLVVPVDLSLAGARESLGRLYEMLGLADNLVLRLRRS